MSWYPFALKVESTTTTTLIPVSTKAEFEDKRRIELQELFSDSLWEYFKDILVGPIGYLRDIITIQITHPRTQKICPHEKCADSHDLFCSLLKGVTDIFRHEDYPNIMNMIHSELDINKDDKIKTGPTDLLIVEAEYYVPIMLEKEEAIHKRKEIWRVFSQFYDTVKSDVIEDKDKQTIKALLNLCFKKTDSHLRVGGAIKEINENKWTYYHVLKLQMIYGATKLYSTLIYCVEIHNKLYKVFTRKNRCVEIIERKQLKSNSISVTIRYDDTQWIKRKIKKFDGSLCLQFSNALCQYGVFIKKLVHQYDRLYNLLKDMHIFEFQHSLKPSGFIAPFGNDTNGCYKCLQQLQLRLPIPDQLWKDMENK